MITESNEVDVASGAASNTHVGSDNTAVGTAIEESANEVPQSAGTVGVNTIDGDGVTQQGRCANFRGR